MSMPEPPARDADAERARTLLEINNAVISSLTQETLFRAIAGALRRIMPFERTAIFLHDAETGVLRLFILESSLPTSYFTVGMEMPQDESHVGWAFREQRHRLCRDLSTERRYPMEERAFQDGIRSYVIVPLIAGGRSVGVLAVASTIPGQYSEADAVLLQEAARQIGLAVENMKAYEAISALHREVRAEAAHRREAEQTLRAALAEVERLRSRLQAENVYLKDEIQTEHNFAEIVGSSPALLELLRKTEQVATTDATVLVFGETGTGKELIARAIHDRSPRRDRPLVKVNSSAISAGLVESELFGHVKGAFTGAIDKHIGRFAVADHGTIFLDEVGELPLETQVKLLRVLQEQEFEPVGSNQTVRVDVRVIAATNRDLEEAVRAGRFRADLFYRLNVFPLRVPPLRERVADIPQLAMFFLERFARRFGRPVEAISAETMDRLARYSWPGNIRELQNVIERAVVLSRGPALELDRDLLPAASRLEPEPAVEQRAECHRPPDALPASGLAAALEETERAHIVAALARAAGVIEGPRGAAQILKVHPNTLRSRMEKLGIRRPGHAAS
jgi:formate hydrogenlyase transcriptional activator